MRKEAVNFDQVKNALELHGKEVKNFSAVLEKYRGLQRKVKPPISNQMFSQKLAKSQQY